MINSIIQMLTSLKDLKDLDGLCEEIFNHNTFLYYFYKAIKGVYNTECPVLNEILFFVNNKLSGNKEEFSNVLFLILNYLHYDLVTLHDNSSPENLFKQYQDLINYQKNYYNNFKHSKISRLFNWVEEKDFQNDKCSFRTKAYLEFDLDEILIHAEKKRNENKLSLINCFEYFSKNKKEINDDLNFISDRNNESTESNCIYHSPRYFLIILNREKDILIEFEKYLVLNNFIGPESKYKKYELIGKIIKNKGNYECLMKNKENNYLEEWILFQDESVKKINNYIYDNNNQEKQSDIKNKIYTKLLCYNGIK